MATAEELLTATGAIDQILFIDLNTRTIKIPNTVLNLGVMADDDVKRIYFRIPEWYGEFKLSNFDIRINYMNAGRNGGIYVSNDSSVDESTGMMTFSWLIDRHVVEYAGTVTFNVCLKLLDAQGGAVKEFNTTTATLEVLGGLEPEESVVEDNPSAFDCVLARLYAVEAANELGRDGHYSIVRITENSEGVVFTLVDQDGETEALVKHAYTPRIGVDYWTPEHQQEMKDYIDTWCPKTVSVILTPEDWIDNEQFVSVDGVSNNSVVLVSGDPSHENYEYYVDEGIKCIGQTDGGLVFGCEYPPNVVLYANVAIFYNKLDTGVSISSVTDDGNGNVYIS